MKLCSYILLSLIYILIRVVVTLRYSYYSKDWNGIATYDIWSCMISDRTVNSSTSGNHTHVITRVSILCRNDK